MSGTRFAPVFATLRPLRPNRSLKEKLMTRPTTILKTILRKRKATILAGAANGLFARVIERLVRRVGYGVDSGIGLHVAAPWSK